MKSVSELRVLIDRIPFAEGNLGEEAILASLLQDLNALGIRDISVFSNMPERTRQRHGKNIHVIPDRSRRWLLLPAEVSRSDLVIWGGGHMLQDRSSRLYIPYVIKTLLLAKVLKTPRFIYAPGLGPVATRSGRRLSRWALREAEGITVRDDVSAEFLKSLGIADQVFQRTADPVFSLSLTAVPSPESQLERPPMIGFAPRRLFYRRGHWMPVSWQLAAREENPRFDRFLQESAAALDQLVERWGARVRLLPMDLGPNPRDDLICYRLRNYMVYQNSCEVFDDDPSVEEFVRRLSELDLLISARLHGIILGMRFGLPFIGIDSDGKIQHLAQSLGYGDYVVRDDECHRDRLVQLANQSLALRETVRQDLTRHHAVLRNRAEQNRTQLKLCLERIAREI